MSKIKKAVEAYQKAVEIKSGNGTFLGELTEKQKKKLSKVDEDITLTDEGKRRKKQELLKETTPDILRKLHDRRTQYKMLLSQAKEDATDVYYHSLEAPNEKKIKEFEIELGQLKTELMLSTNEETAKHKFDTFIEKVTDPYLANRVVEAYGELSGYLLGVAKNPQRTKLELSRKYTQIRSANLTEEQRQARDILESTEAALQTTSFYRNPLIDADFTMPSHTKNLRAVIEPGADKYIDNTETYFEQVEGEGDSN